MQRLPPLRLLTTFETFARLGSMRLAATALNVTQPAVTQALKALEEHVGAVLVDRSTRPARLTEAGQQLARATRDGLDLIAAAIDEIGSEAEGRDLQITVSCTLGMATYWLMPRLPEFYAEHPDYLVNVQAPPSDLPAIGAGVDVALRYGARTGGPGGGKDGATDKLFDEIVCPVGRPELIERLLAAETGLARAPIVHVRNSETRHWAGWPEYLARCGSGRHRGPSQFFDNYVQAVQAALDGRGLVLGWRSITAGLVSEGALIPWPEGDVDLKTAYFVTMSHGSAGKPAPLAFVAWLRRYAG